MPGTFWDAAEKLRPFMEDLRAGAERRWDDYGKAPEKGVYVLYERGKAIYVGRSNRMRDRLRQQALR